jgi:predicted CoA-binding protein
MADKNRIKEILETYKKITVIGLSPRSDRDSFRVADYLIGKDYELSGIHPEAKQILGAVIYQDLKEIPHDLEIVDVFRAPQHVPEIIDQLIPLKPKVIWLQEGVTHPEAEEKARAAGIEVFSDICIKKLHQELFAY